VPPTCTSRASTAGPARRRSASAPGSSSSPAAARPDPAILPFLSIPSPSSPFIVTIGSFRLRWYGTLLALGVLLGGWLTGRELTRRGLDPDKVYGIAVWAVPGGVLGARLYHVLTDWHRFDGHLAEIPQLWHGGLGLPGVIAGGTLGAYIGARRQGLVPLVVFDCVAPGLIAAQALGRWGNWANQELFGGPTSLPWGVEIDPANRPARYADAATFQPTFLYESIWNALVLFLLYRLIRRGYRTLPAGAIFAAYLAMYSAGRFVIEGMRVDPANQVLGVRINQWLFGVVFLLATGWFVTAYRRRRPSAAIDDAADLDLETATPPGAPRAGGPGA
jgi:prolipoprotein diacylglyceryl transferase